MNGTVTISRRIEWDMAHRLGPRCTTKCKNLHGHRYVAIATLSAETTDELGMVLDFGDAFRAMKGFVDGHLDHACVVDRGDAALLEFLVAWSSSYDVGHVFVTAGVATVLQLLPLCNGARAHTHTHSHAKKRFSSR